MSPHPTLDRKNVLVGAVRTAYIDHGSGETIVALHGIPTSSRLFEPLAPLIPGFRLLAPDLLGQGKTAVPPRGRLGHAEYRRHLAMFLNLLAPPEFHLMVHDFGGVLGLEWAADHPDRVKTLTVLSTTARWTLRWTLPGRSLHPADLLSGANVLPPAL